MSPDRRHRRLKPEAGTEAAFDDSKFSAAVGYLTILTVRLRDNQQKYKFLMCLRDPEVLNEGSKQEELKQFFTEASLKQDQIDEILRVLKSFRAQTTIVNQLLKNPSLKKLVALGAPNNEPLEITAEAVLQMKILEEVPTLFPSITELKAAFMYLEGEGTDILSDEQKDFLGKLIRAGLTKFGLNVLMQMAEEKGFLNLM